jgi:hypothetical protein
MDALSITGCWEGTLLSDQGDVALPFSLRQPPRALTPVRTPTIRVGSDAALPTTVLDGTSHAIVALADESLDPTTGDMARLLVDARVRGDRLVGRWLRRDHAGRVLATGSLSAGRGIAD